MDSGPGSSSNNPPGTAGASGTGNRNGEELTFTTLTSAQTSANASAGSSGIVQPTFVAVQEQVGPDFIPSVHGKFEVVGRWVVLIHHLLCSNRRFSLQDIRRDSQDGMGDEYGAAGGDTGELREQDRFLPIANVARIMKKGIPSVQGKIAKDARECVQECVSEFISFITSEASDRCQVSESLRMCVKMC